MHTDLIKQSPKAAVPAPGDFDLGTWLGRSQAFGMMAGKASAADAECLRRIRNQRLYKSKTPSWREFCARYLGASQANVNRIIQYLEEFGPEFFQVAQLARVTPEAYRAIAPHVTRDGLCFGGEVIALLPENAAKVSEAVGELRRQSGARDGAVPRAGFREVRKRLECVPAQLDALRGSLGEDEKAALKSVLSRIVVSAVMAGVSVAAGEPD